MRKSVLAAAAAFAVAGGAMSIQASAADLDFAPPPPVFVPTWAGFYVGGHVGFGEGTVDFRQDLDITAFGDIVDVTDFNTFRSGTNPDGLVGGAQGGYNWQVRSLVFGIEADISFTDWDESVTVFDSEVDTVDGLIEGEGAFGTASTDINFLASVRGRLGYAFGNVMVYGTGGVAWADAEARARMVFTDGEVEISDQSRKEDLDGFGFVAGGGLAWMVIPQTFSVGVEGLYYWFDEKETLIDETFEVVGGEADIRATAELHDAWVVRARADFHF
jgi:outer membrane immunogenic protein